MAKETTKTKAAVNFPARELNAWLKAHPSWSHHDWLALLDTLKQKGFANLAGSKEGQDSIGLFLETNRKVK